MVHRPNYSGINDQVPRKVEVLIVDDNPGDLALIRESFRECSLATEVIPALDADRAFAILNDLSRNPPDLIILDVNLPRIDGFEVLRRIRADERLNATPVLMMSSSTMPADVWRAYDLHANAYVAKPSQLEDYFDIARGIAALWLEPLANISARSVEPV